MIKINLSPEYFDLIDFFTQLEINNNELNFYTYQNIAFKFDFPTKDMQLLKEAIHYNEKTYFFIEGDPKKIPSYKKLFENHLNIYFKTLEEEHKWDTDSLISKDIDHLLVINNDSSIKLPEALHTFFGFLSSHLLFESAHILYTKDDFLYSMASTNRYFPMDFTKVDQLLINNDTSAYEALVNNKIIISNKEHEKILLKQLKIDFDVENIYFFPIKNNSYELGVLVLVNIHEFYHEHYTKNIISKFGVSLGHLLYQDRFHEQLKNKTRITNDLKSYVSKNLFSNLDGSSTKRFDEGEKKEVVCLFADIRKFTTISEPLDPELLVKLLNYYFSAIIPIIEDSGGTIDKLVGDMVVAIWNAPKNIEDFEVRAIQAAIKMQKYTVQKVAPFWAKHGVKYMGIGVGLDVGPSFVGNIGSSFFNNFTTLGNVPQFANYLESLARPAEVWMSEKLYNRVSYKLPKAAKRVNVEFKKKKKLAYQLKVEEYPDYTK